LIKTLTRQKVIITYEYLGILRASFKVSPQVIIILLKVVLKNMTVTDGFDKEEDFNIIVNDKVFGRL